MFPTKRPNFCQISHSGTFPTKRLTFALGVISDETTEFPPNFALGTIPTKRPNFRRISHSGTFPTKRPNFRL
ncbi:MAG: hypothetical protein Q8881_04390, partial [Sweet potato little leaf phytoplasma]|nr:hypothetical protein [Sweet potato little leaf phytoplasma]